MLLSEAYDFLDHKISIGYVPEGCYDWWKKRYEVLHGSDPTRACHLANCMVRFRKEMGLTISQASNLFEDALTMQAVKFTQGSIIIWGAVVGMSATMVFNRGTTTTEDLIREELASMKLTLERIESLAKRAEKDAGIARMNSTKCLVELRDYVNSTTTGE